MGEKLLDHQSSHSSNLSTSSVLLTSLLERRNIQGPKIPVAELLVLDLPLVFVNGSSNGATLGPNVTAPSVLILSPIANRRLDSSNQDIKLSYCSCILLSHSLCFLKESTSGAFLIRFHPTQRETSSAFADPNFQRN